MGARKQNICIYKDTIMMRNVKVIIIMKSITEVLDNS
jgi:hypothetical protein